MAITDDNVTDLIRSMLSESSAKYWTDAEIILYKTMAMSKLLSRWGPWLFHEKQTWEDFGPTASTSERDLPDNCYKVAWIVNKTDGDKLRYITPDEFWKYRDYSDGDPTMWTFKGGKVHWIPTPSTTDTDLFELVYMPILDAVTEFPDAMRPLIVIEAVILAKYKDVAVGPDIFKLKDDYEMAIMHDLALQQREPIIFCDYIDEDGYE